MKNQKGFSAVEGLLILVVVGILGFAGWYVWNAKSNANKNLNAAASANLAATPKGDKGSGGPQTGPAKTEVFIINEWNVFAEIPTPPEEADLIQYKITNDSSGQFASFTTQQLIDLDKEGCSIDSAPAGVVNRAKATDKFLLADGSESGQTVAQQMATMDSASYKKVGEYYYWYSHPQGACSDKASATKLQDAAIKEVQAIVSLLAQG